MLNEHRNEVPDGQVGELYSRTSYVFDGYWKNPEKTAEAVAGEWCSVGDMARRDEQGYIWLVDRKSNMIISGGENIYSTEVENAISLMPGVAEIAVVGIPDDKWGERVHAIVVPREGANLTPEAVQAWAREKIAGYKVPRSVLIRAERLPLSGAGKVLKNELRAPYWAGRGKKI